MICIRKFVKKFFLNVDYSRCLIGTYQRCQPFHVILSHLFSCVQMSETASVDVINIAKVMRVQHLILQLSKQEAGERGNTLYTTSRESLMGGIHTITSISAQLSFNPSTHLILVLWRAFVWALYASRGRILGRNPDKSKSFPPCYSESSLQLCLETFIF
jgi:hypothetical protein